MSPTRQQRGKSGRRFRGNICYGPRLTHANRLHDCNEASVEKVDSHRYQFGDRFYDPCHWSVCFCPISQEVTSYVLQFLLLAHYSYQDKRTPIVCWHSARERFF